MQEEGARMIHVPNGLELEALKELIFDLIYRLLTYRNIYGCMCYVVLSFSVMSNSLQPHGL